MSNLSTKKSVFDRIGASGNNSSATTNFTSKSTHGFCISFLKTGTCSLGDSCKYIHEQLNSDKQSASKDEMRITTKTTTRVIDMSSTPIKSTVTVSNEQRPVVLPNAIQSTRTVVEGVNTSTVDHSQDRRSSGSDKKQVDNQSARHAQNRTNDSKSKSSSKKKSQTSSHETRHSSSKKTRSNESDSSASSTSDAEQSEIFHKPKRKISSHTSTSKHRKHESISPRHDNDETLNDQNNRPNSTSNKSPKRTIVLTDRKKDQTLKANDKCLKSKTNPDIEFLGSKKVNRNTKTTETIHQQTENTKKTIEIKREKKSPSDRQRQYSSSTNEKMKSQQSSDQLSPNNEKLLSSPPCVILDDDSSPTPSIDKKSSEKKLNENEKTNSGSTTTTKSSKRSRESETNHSKEKTSNEHSDVKRKRLNDERSRKTSSTSKNENDNRSANNRSDTRRNTNTSSRDELLNRKYKDKIDSKTNRNRNSSKDRTATVSSSSKSRSSHDRRDATRSSSDKKHASHRRRKEKDFENVTDSEDHTGEIIVPKQTALESYMSMDWSLLSRDKRIPLNTQVTSRTMQNNQLIIASERLLTNEQKQELNKIECHQLPLTHFMKQLQIKPKIQLINSCQQRFGSCAKDMIEMRHQWFIKSIEPVQQYEFINKEHYLVFQQASNCLFDKTSTDISSAQIETTSMDVSSVQIETTSADVLLT